MVDVSILDTDLIRDYFRYFHNDQVGNFFFLKHNRSNGDSLVNNDENGWPCVSNFLRIYIIILVF
jgi:hypothetical protein